MGNEKIYKIRRKINGVMTDDYVMLSGPDGTDCLYLLYRLALEHCRATREGRDLYNREQGLTLAQALACVKPEDLAQNKVTVTWLSDVAIPTDSRVKLVGPYEMESYMSARRELENDFRRIYNCATSIAQRLERERNKQTPVVSIWDAKQIVSKSLSWAHWYVKEKESDFDTFFAQKLGELAADAAGSAEPSGSTDVA